MSSRRIPINGGRSARRHADIGRKRTLNDRKDTTMMSNALASTGRGIVICDATQTGCPIIFANPAFLRITGYELAEVVGRNCRFLQNGESGQAALSAVRSAIATQTEAHVVLRNYRKDGSLFWNDLLLSPLRDESGKVTRFIGVQTDISEQKRDQEQLAFLMTHDKLTGLPNRTLLMERLQQAVQQAQRQASPAALLFIDIDHFQQISAGLGQDTRNRILKDIAQRLRACVKESDTLSHYGDGKFAWILNDAGDPGYVSASCDRISGIIAEPLIIDDQMFRAACHIGIAQCPQDSDDAPTLSQYASIALHHAKDLGNKSHLFFSSEINARMAQRVALEAALRSAIHNEQFHLVYQPKVELQTGRITGLEALLRWQHPQLDVVAPATFITIAEELGLIVSIGEWVLRQTCRHLRSWIDTGIQFPRVSIKMSPSQLRDPLLAQKIEQALSEERIDPAMVSFAITEGILMGDTQSIEITLRKLKALGVTLALDDFGIGYSSFSYLRRFPFDQIKIDPSFIKNIVTDSNDAAIANAIISMAHSLGLQAVAEGVETNAQCELLCDLLCDEMQGNLFSKPMAPGDIMTLLREDRRLPDHLLRTQKASRTLLLVDDEQNILAALKRLLRRDGYQILTANSAQEGLEMLTGNKVDVILSDQRMPGMNGVEFLRTAKISYPDTVRIVLSGYTELQSVTDAINEGAVYRFLTKPWEDQQLRDHIEEAFQHKEMADENRRLNLQVRTANQNLATANRQLEEVLQQQRQQIIRDEASLDIVREALQHVPLPVIGLDDDNMVAFANDAAHSLFKDVGPILGSDATQLIPELLHATHATGKDGRCTVKLNEVLFQVAVRSMGQGSQSRGKLMTLTQLVPFGVKS